MKTFLVFIAMLISLNGFSQVVGKVVDKDGQPLRAVNVYKKDSYQGTTTNTKGAYQLNLEKTGQQTLVFQYLGFKTVQKKVSIDSFPYELNVTLKEQPDALSEVVIHAGENPADRIIKKAIANRKKNLAKIKAYTADFYSKGNWALDSVPKRILGHKIENQELSDMGLDSTGNGILYLSETTSQIKYKAPDHFHEHILASKVSGDDNGFSLNSARDANYSFYHNTIELNANLVSPIADYAFSYYRYKMVGTSYDQQGHLINKIKVIPKQPDDRVFSGFIYIVEDSWQIYGIALKTTGTSAHIPPVRELHFNQSFKYSEEQGFWVKISQDVNFSFKLLGFSGTGQFIAVYSQYDFSPHFTKNSFNNEVMNYAQHANKKDSLFWQKARPMPLTPEEAEDYVKKDSLQKAHRAPAYLDSVDRKANKFALLDILFGYRYQNSSKHFAFKMSSPLFGTHFNTVQGWNTTINFSFTKRNKEARTYWKLFSDMSYGFADHRYRVSGGFETKLNNFSKPYLKLEGGVKAEQINNTDPFPMRINDVANIFFERNYLKLYNKHYIQARYTEELFNGFRLYTRLGFERRNPLINHTDHVIRHDANGGYTSNNPLAPEDFGSLAFKPHNIGKFYAAFRMNFGQKYYSYPDGKYAETNNDYPTLSLGYEKGFASTVSDYNFDQLQFTLEQDLDLKNLGKLSYQGKIGKFFHGDHIALVDFKHFNGNQMRVAARGNYVGKFNLLPYYMLSTNDQYAEAHAEQNFKGYVLGKIPFINRLNFNLVLDAHALWTAGNNPYQEYSIGLDNLGFGSFRFFRIDYVQSVYKGTHKGAVIFGLQFLNAF